MTRVVASLFLICALGLPISAQAEPIRAEAHLDFGFFNITVPDGWTVDDEFHGHTIGNSTGTFGGGGTFTATDGPYMTIENLYNLHFAVTGQGEGVVGVGLFESLRISSGTEGYAEAATRLSGFGFTTDEHFISSDTPGFSYSDGLVSEGGIGVVRHLSFLPSHPTKTFLSVQLLSRTVDQQLGARIPEPSTSLLLLGACLFGLPFVRSLRW